MILIHNLPPELGLMKEQVQYIMMADTYVFSAMPYVYIRLAIYHQHRDDDALPKENWQIWDYYHMEGVSSGPLRVSEN